MKQKEQWTNDILDSLGGIQRAEPDEVLLSRIMAALPDNPLIARIPRWQLRWAAVAACVLVVANIYVLNVGRGLTTTGLTTTVSATSQTTTVINDDAMTLFSDYSLYQ